MMMALVVSGFLIGLALSGWFVWQIGQRSVARWLVIYLKKNPKRSPPQKGKPVHLLLCIADHFEPNWGGAARDLAEARVAAWVDRYPRLFGQFRDSDGRPPRHSFFFPLEEYDARHLEMLAELCWQGFGEVEVHLHHHNDSPQSLRENLSDYKELLAGRHGLLSRHRDTGELAYGFIHGNWALDNSRPDGRWCGVNNELDILRETGCYADFTMPSAPDSTQTRKINSIYYAVDDPVRPKSHDTGIDVGCRPAPANALLLIQGPLLLDWGRRQSRLFPGIENGCIQNNQPPSLRRLDLWLRARVQMPARLDWFFVKLHTHGAKESNQRVLLGEPMIRFHQALAQRARQDTDFHFHYVTAREMFNLVRAAEAKWKGTIDEARDFQLLWNGSRPGGGIGRKNKDKQKFLSQNFYVPE
jgi:hypothetical protein